MQNDLGPDPLDAGRPPALTGAALSSQADPVLPHQPELEPLSPASLSPASLSPAPIPYDLIELLFFAYRDFVSDPDRILEHYGFGRAHHRVLHFVNRRAGLTIATLLDILKITKQSLNRVLKELIEQGYIESRAGDSDRRQRLLFPTPRGEKLAHDLALLQSQRIVQALQETGPEHRTAIAAYLKALINPSERNEIEPHLSAREATPSNRPPHQGSNG